MTACEDTGWMRTSHEDEWRWGFMCNGWLLSKARGRAAHNRWAPISFLGRIKMSTLPDIGGDPGLAGLSEDHLSLYRNVERWLSANRGVLGQNQHLRLAQPRATHAGITCKVINVVRGGRDLIDLFKGYDPHCSDVRQMYDDETSQHLYRVDVPFPRSGTAPLDSGAAPSCWSRWIDDPLSISAGFVLTLAVASVTTRAEQWSELAGVFL